MADHDSLSRRTALKLFGASALLATPTLAQDKKPAPPNLQGAGFYRFSVGDLRCALVSDGVGAMPPQNFAVNAPADALKAEMDNRFLGGDAVPLHVNVLLVQTGKANVLVDTGCGGLFGPTLGQAPARLARLGVEPGDITHVVVTHAHGDHIGGLSAFDQAEIVVTKAEHDFWTGAAPDLSKTALPEDWRKGFIERARGTLAATKPRLRLLEPGKQVADGVELVDAAGHTPGHVGLQLSSGDGTLLYITDAIHFAPLQLANPGWHVAFDTDPQQAAKTRRTILDRAATDRVLVSGAHLPFPALGHVRKRGTGFEWEPSIWQW